MIVFYSLVLFYTPKTTLYSYAHKIVDFYAHLKVSFYADFTEFMRILLISESLTDRSLQIISISSYFSAPDSFCSCSLCRRTRLVSPSIIMRWEVTHGHMSELHAVLADVCPFLFHVQITRHTSQWHLWKARAAYTQLHVPWCWRVFRRVVLSRGFLCVKKRVTKKNLKKEMNK